MKIVQFYDGTYGVQRGIGPFKSYFDVREKDFWWGSPRHVDSWCKVKTYEEAVNLFHIAKITHKDV